ncbi:MAG: hypothetical protein K5989_09540 [Lachnospiraceae bacterium]|nr:hypothetical protein [Lachnospiraceae bacterium]
MQKAVFFAFSSGKGIVETAGFIVYAGQPTDRPEQADARPGIEERRRTAHGQTGTGGRPARD